MAGLVRTRLGKSIADAGWSSFTQMLEYQARKHGRTFGRAGRWGPTSQVCSACEARDGPKPLSPSGRGGRQGRHMPRFRPTARLLVLDPAGRILLFSAADPRGTAWFTPGGGVHRGESLEAAAARELAEETGHVRAEADIGPVVATSAGLWTTARGRTFFGADAYFLVRVAEPRVNTDGQEAFERSVITGHRWWTTGELRVTSDKIVPNGLSDLLDSLLSDGVPAAPMRLAWRSGT